MQMSIAATRTLAPQPIPRRRRYLRPVATALAGRAETLAAALLELSGHADATAALAAALVETVRGGGKVLVAGNGGSAAEAQHFATELIGRFRRERAPIAALALTADTAILTAVGNDYGYEEIFARQVRGLAQPGDLLLLFSTSGESENLVQAAVAARERGVTVAAITGGQASRLGDLADLVIFAPSGDTPLVQEIHVVLLHLLCDIVEAEMVRDQERAR
jgi:D-sedoheptulose 7-phosphate isomerase